MDMINGFNHAKFLQKYEVEVINRSGRHDAGYTIRSNRKVYKCHNEIWYYWVHTHWSGNVVILAKFYRMLYKWQLLVQPVSKMSSKWRFHFSAIRYDMTKEYDMILGQDRILSWLYIILPMTFIHYSDVILSVMAFQITGASIVYSFVQAQIKENIKAPRHWPLWWEFTGFTGDRWIPRTKGQQRGNWFLFDDVIMHVRWHIVNWTTKLL